MALVLSTHGEIRKQKKNLLLFVLKPPSKWLELSSEYCGTLWYTAMYCEQGPPWYLAYGFSKRWSVPVCWSDSETVGESEGKQLFGLAQWGHVLCTYSSLDRWMWAPEVGMYIHIHYDKHICPHTCYTKHRHTHTQSYIHTHTHWWIHSQNSLDQNQLHVLCRLYAVWFGIANRLETWQVTSGKSGSHQPYDCMPNWDMGDRMRHSLPALKYSTSF